jgi:hypothetical protein
MAMTLRTIARTALCNALITDLGANHKALFYNGSKPASLGTAGGTLLATLTGGSTAGTASAGVLTFGSYTQTNSGHVNGTPTYVRFTLSDNTVVCDIDIGAGAGNLTFTGAVVNGQNITTTGLTWTAPNA